MVDVARNAVKKAIFSAVATSTHVAKQLLAFRKLCQSQLLNRPPWSESVITSCFGLGRQTAISKASITRLLVICGFIDKPSTCPRKQTKHDRPKSHGALVNVHRYVAAQILTRAT